MHSRASDDDDDDETSAGGYVAHRRRLRAATPKTRTTFAVDRRPRPERSAGYIARRSSALRESGVRARARCVKISSSPAAVDDRESAYALRGCLRPRQRFRSTFVFETYVALTPGEYGYSRGFGGVRSSHSTACRSPETRTPYEYGRAAGPLASTDGFRSFGRSGEYATRALSRAPVGLAVPSLPRDTTRRTRVLTARSPLRDGEFEAGRNAAHDERTRDEGGYRTGRAIPGVSGIAARTLARVLERRSLQRRRIGAATRPTRSARETSPPTRPRGTKSTGDARPQNSIARDHSQRARPSPTGKTDTRTLQYTETTPRRTQLEKKKKRRTTSAREYRVLAAVVSSTDARRLYARRLVFTNAVFVVVVTTRRLTLRRSCLADKTNLRAKGSLNKSNKLYVKAIKLTHRKPKKRRATYRVNSITEAAPCLRHQRKQLSHMQFYGLQIIISLVLCISQQLLPSRKMYAADAFTSPYIIVSPVERYSALRASHIA
ncbi:hypothetical protein V9T40_010162 [Parthenolecanium corni]|uniref:Uncharacterized protein n=1 Tax=Parthenolecanium corni TaxID=536013 RepID=A0AAN9T2E9_9HEMI